MLGAVPWADANRLYLAGNELPRRWAGQPRFVVLETGFGLGHNFLATWRAWQQDPRRCEQLWYIAIDPQRASRESLALAHGQATATASASASASASATASAATLASDPALHGLATELIARWPLPTPDLHLLAFDGGRVRLLLARQEISQGLPEIVARVDAFYLAQFAPGNTASGWDLHRVRSLPRLAAPGATLATWNTDDAVSQALRSAGFELETHVSLGDAPPGAARSMTVGRFAPRFQSPAPPGRQSPHSARRVAIVGAGLAGAAVARALAAQGVTVHVFDRQAGCALETSGNAGGLFHGIVHGHDGPHARWLRAGALHTERVLRPLIKSGQVPGAMDGLLRGEQSLSAEAMQALIQQQALPAEYVQVRAGAFQGGGPAWLYPGGGWVEPGALCAAWLGAPGIQTSFNTVVQRLEASANGWRLLGADGHFLDEVQAVVLCNAGDAARLVGGLAVDATADGGLAGAADRASDGTAGLAWQSTNPAAWPLQLVRGQTTLLPAHIAGLPALPQPLADAGYALRLQGGRVLCGGGASPDGERDLGPLGNPDDDTQLRPGDQAAHLATLRRLTGWAGTVDAADLGGRVGWRLQTDDRLPLLGPVPGQPTGTTVPQARRLDQPRFITRQPGLYVFTALGSRGITQAALGGELLASWLTGAPMAAPSSLLDALDAARFVARAARLASR